MYDTNRPAFLETVLVDLSMDGNSAVTGTTTFGYINWVIFYNSTLVGSPVLALLII